MKRTKNEIKERQGKIFLGCLISTPLLLMGIFYFVLVAHFDGCGDDFKRNLKSRNTALDLTDFLKEKQRFYFKGRDKIDGVETVISLEFLRMNRRFFKYKLEIIDDENGTSVIAGIAKLDKTTATTDTFEISYGTNKRTPAYRFYDKAKYWQVEIGISKQDLGVPRVANFKKTFKNEAQNLAFVLQQD